MSTRRNALANDWLSFYGLRQDGRWRDTPERNLFLGPCEESQFYLQVRPLSHVKCTGPGEMVAVPYTAVDHILIDSGGDLVLCVRGSVRTKDGPLRWQPGGESGLPAGA